MFNTPLLVSDDGAYESANQEHFKTPLYAPFSANDHDPINLGGSATTMKDVLAWDFRLPNKRNGRDKDWRRSNRMSRDRSREWRSRGPNRSTECSPSPAPVSPALPLDLGKYADQSESEDVYKPLYRDSDCENDGDGVDRLSEEEEIDQHVTNVRRGRPLVISLNTGRRIMHGSDMGADFSPFRSGSFAYETPIMEAEEISARNMDVEGTPRRRKVAKPKRRKIQPAENSDELAKAVKAHKPTQVVYITSQKRYIFHGNVRRERKVNSDSSLVAAMHINKSLSWDKRIFAPVVHTPGCLGIHGFYSGMELAIIRWPEMHSLFPTTAYKERSFWCRVLLVKKNFYVQPEDHRGQPVPFHEAYSIVTGIKLSHDEHMRPVSFGVGRKGAFVEPHVNWEGLKALTPDRTRSLIAEAMGVIEVRVRRFRKEATCGTTRNNPSKLLNILENRLRSNDEQFVY